MRENLVPACYASLFPQLAALGLADWAGRLPAILAEIFDARRHGNLPDWWAAIDALPPVMPSQIELRERVAIGRPEDVVGFDRDSILRHLKSLHPWRKGPFRLFGIDIDTEWRSDWKWDRLLPHIAPLAGRRVLDVGCGNGYHGWRMRGAGAAFVLGLDPVLLYVLQHLVLQRYLDDPHFHLLPLRMEDLPAAPGCFDTVFSMGVLYHRRAPLDHLLELKEALRPGGELVLETLVIDGDVQAVLTPPGRYAKMRNVWFIPSVATLEVWLARCGFTGIRCVDVTRTTTGEQRATDWMIEESLADFLDPLDPTRTIEGHPAPTRAILVANKG